MPDFPAAMDMAMEKMPHGEHRTPVQSRQLLRHTIRAENQVLWPNHGMIPSLKNGVNV
jgi:hypothetical protein